MLAKNAKVKNPRLFVKVPLANDLPEDGGYSGNLPVKRPQNPEGKGVPVWNFPVTQEPQEIQTLGGVEPDVRPVRPEPVFKSPNIEGKGIPVINFPKKPESSVMTEEENPPVTEALQPVNPLLSEKPLTRREQILKEIDERQNKKFNDKWSFLDTLKGAGIGFLKAFASGSGSIRDRLLQGAGGAGMGAVEGSIDPNFDEKWGNEQHLNNLYQRYAQAAQVEQDDAKQAQAESEQEYKNAQIKELFRKPEKEAQARKDKFDLEAQRQLNRLAVLKEKDGIEGKKWKLLTRNGKYFKQFNDGREEPLINPQTGEQEIDLLNMPVETTSENGTKGYAKFGQILNADATQNYRDAVLGLQREKFEEDKKQNKIRNEQWERNFQQNRSNFVDLLNLRKQALEMQQKAAENKDEAGSLKAANDLRDLDYKIRNLKAAWKARIGTGGFTEEDYNQLVEDLP